MRVAHLFAGAGGSLLAGDLLGWEHVVAAEVDPYCRAVLAARWPGVELWGDVGAEPWGELAGRVDLVVGGWPCQPVSSAGRRLAGADHRDGWPALAGAVRLLRPRYLFLENVAAVLTAERGQYFGRCLADLAALGFDARWTVLRASDAGAPHRRERLWLFAWQVAHPYRDGLGRLPGQGGQGPNGAEFGEHAPGRGGQTLADPGRGGLQRRRELGDMASPAGSPQDEEDQWKRLCAAVGDSCSTPLGGEQVADPASDGWDEGGHGEGGAAGGRHGGEPAHGSGQVGGLAHADRQRHHERDPLRHPRGEVERGGLADAEGAGWGRERRAAEPSDRPEIELDRCGSAGPSLGPVGGGAHGLAAGLPWPGASGVWPAGRGQEQETWEPARTCGRVPTRRQQLKALGNGWVPAQAVLAWRILTGV